MEVPIKRIIKKATKWWDVFHSNVQMERNIAEKTPVIKKSLCFISICYLKKTTQL